MLAAWLKRLLVAGLFCGLLGSARADSWLPPSTQEVLSADGRTRVVVTPRALEGAHAYFADKVAGTPAPGQDPASPSIQATARLQQRAADGQWLTRWQRPLVNDVAPVTVLVANRGRWLVTLDNWHGLGYGDDVLVVYDADGRRLHQFALADLLPAEYIAGLPHSVSSLHWRGEARLRDGDALLEIELVVAGEEAFREPEFLPLRVDLSQGRVMLPQGPDWERAMAGARAQIARQRAEHERMRARRAAPLHAPASSNDRDWQDYLLEVAARVYSDDSGIPYSFYVPLPSMPQHARRLKELDKAVAGFALRDDGSPRHSTGLWIIASPQPHPVAEALIAALDRLPPAAALGQNLVFIGTPDLQPRLRQAAERVGAGFRFIDTTRPLAGVDLPARDDRPADR